MTYPKNFAKTINMQIKILQGSGRFVPPHQEQAYANLPPRFQDSAASNVHSRPPPQPPGRIEDMASPVSPYNQVNIKIRPTLSTTEFFIKVCADEIGTVTAL